MKFVATLADLRGETSMLTVRWLLLSLALIVGAAQSLEPSPSPAKTSQEQKADANKTSKDAKGTQKKSKKSPLSVTIDTQSQ